MQFDVHRNPIASRRGIAPFVAILQADIADTGRERIVAFLVAQHALRAVAGRLMPIVEIEGKDFVLLVPSLTGIPAAELKAPLGTIASYRDAIVEALDWLFLGI
ncbi:MAG: CcdB family protein [Bauldia sp.]|nr:CcdB family protein [Bauldia sp.]